MRFKKFTVYLVLMAMALGAVSCKKKDTGAENAGQEDQSTETGAASDSSEKKDNNGSASAEVTEENLKITAISVLTPFWPGNDVQVVPPTPQP